MENLENTDPISNLMSSLLASAKGPVASGTSINKNNTDKSQLLDILNSQRSSASSAAFSSPNTKASQNRELIDLDLCLTEAKDLPVSTVATMKREPKRVFGNLVASNGVFIAYSSKSGVRLIRQSDGVFTLLKSHSGPVLDIAMTRFEIIEQTRLCSISESRLVLEEILSDGDVSSRVLLSIDSSFPEEKIKGCIFSSDGSSLFFYTDRGALFTVDLEYFAKMGSSGVEVSFASLVSLPFVTVMIYPQSIQSISAHPWDLKYVVGSDNGAVFIEGSGKALIQAHSRSLSQIFALNSYIITTGIDDCFCIKSWDTENDNHCVSEMRFTTAGNSIENDETIKVAFHQSSDSLYCSFSGLLLKMKIKSGRLSLESSWRIAGEVMSLSTDGDALSQTEIFMVTESAVIMASFTKDSRELIHNVKYDPEPPTEMLPVECVSATEELEEYLSNANDICCPPEKSLVYDPGKSFIHDTEHSLNSVRNEEAFILNGVEAMLSMHLQAFSQHLNQYIPDMVSHGIETSLATRTEKIRENVKVDIDAEELSQRIIEKVVPIVSDRVADSVNSGFENILIPAYQNATQVMFKQMHQAFQQGFITIVADLKASVDQLTDKVKSLESEKGDQTTVLLENIISRMKIFEQQAVSPTNPAERIERLVNDEKYENAFAMALESADLNLVATTISKISVSKVFLENSCLLSQPIVLSLLQQLSLLLDDQPKDKLLWIQECLLALDMKNHSIAEHLPKIMPGVVRRLEEAARVSQGDTALTLNFVSKVARNLSLYR